MIKNENQLRELLGSVEMKKCVKTLVVSEWCGNGIKDDLNLCGFDNLESLVVKKCSLRYLNSLKVSDNDKLNSIEIEDGEWRDSPVYQPPVFTTYCDPNYWIPNPTLSSMIIDY